jgi:hypothetical protein
MAFLQQVQQALHLNVILLASMATPIQKVLLTRVNLKIVLMMMPPLIPCYRALVWVVIALPPLHFFLGSAMIAQAVWLQWDFLAPFLTSVQYPVDIAQKFLQPIPVDP